VAARLGGGCWRSCMSSFFHTMLHRRGRPLVRRASSPPLRERGKRTKPPLTPTPSKRSATTATLAPATSPSSSAAVFTRQRKRSSVAAVGLSLPDVKQLLSELYPDEKVRSMLFNTEGKQDEGVCVCRTCTLCLWGRTPSPHRTSPRSQSRGIASSLLPMRSCSVTALLLGGSQQLCRDSLKPRSRTVTCW
jgi:hypothetical protein